MLSNTISARRSPALALTVLSTVAGRAVTLSGARGGAACAAASILEYFAGRGETRAAAAACLGGGAEEKR
jgi:hypothetical protein